MNNTKNYDIFFRLVKDGNLKKIKDFTENKNINVNTPSFTFFEYNGLTALHIASIFGHIDTVKYLIEEKNADDTEIYIYMQTNDESIIENSNIYFKFDTGIWRKMMMYSRAIHFAIKNNHYNIVKYFGELHKSKGINLLDTTFKSASDCELPISVALSELCDYSIIEYLVNEYRVNLNISDERKYPLHYLFQLKYNFTNNWKKQMLKKYNLNSSFKNFYEYFFANLYTVVSILDNHMKLNNILKCVEIYKKYSSLSELTQNDDLYHSIITIGFQLERTVEPLKLLLKNGAEPNLKTSSIWKDEQGLNLPDFLINEIIYFFETIE